MVLLLVIDVEFSRCLAVWCFSVIITAYAIINAVNDRWTATFVNLLEYLWRKSFQCEKICFYLVLLNFDQVLLEGKLMTVVFNGCNEILKPRVFGLIL